MSLIAIIAGVMGPNCVSCYRCSLTNVKSLATVDNCPFFVSSLHAFLSFPLLIILFGFGLLVYRLSIYPIHPILSILSLFHLFPSSYLISYPSHLTQHRLPKHPSHVLLWRHTTTRVSWRRVNIGRVTSLLLWRVREVSRGGREPPWVLPWKYANRIPFSQAVCERLAN